MSGPIVRSAPSKKFTANWNTAFGGKGGGASKAKSAGKAAAKKSSKKKR